MGKLKYLLLILLFLVGAAILLGMRFPQGASGSIEGFVRDENGTPIARVSIQAFNIMHGETSAASAQLNGFFRIVDIAGGRYSLWIEAKGYTSAHIPMVIVESGQATRKDIQLKRDLLAK
jgi:hypothetical protein